MPGYRKREILSMLVGLVRSQGPSHDPKHEKLPELAGRWFKRYEENPKSAARWYTVGAGRRLTSCASPSRVPDMAA